MIEFIDKDTQKSAQTLFPNVMPIEILYQMFGDNEFRLGKKDENSGN